MNTHTLARVGLVTCTLIAAATPASAGILDPIISFLEDVLSDVESIITVVGALAFIIALIMMMFGQSNAWKIAVIAVVIVLAANARTIVGALQ